MASEFDLDSFLDQRAEAEAGATPAFDAFAIENATSLGMKGSKKIYDLDGIAEAKKRNVEESLVGKLGFTPGASGTESLNAAASLVSGASRTIGQLVNLPINAAAQLAQAGVSEEAIQAYNRIQAGQAEPGDEAILASPAPVGEDGIAQTYGERLQGVAGLRDTAKSIADFFDISSIVDTTRRDRLSRDLADNTSRGVEQLRQAATDYEEGNYLDAALNALLGTGRTVASAVPSAAVNPTAVGEYTAENIPQLAAAAVSAPLGVATNLGYAADELREGYTDYARDNDGQLPDQGDRLKMGLAAASAALAEQVGDLSVLRGIRGETGGLVRSTLGTSAKEGVTEGYQTWAENVAHLEDTTIEQIVEAATIGAAVGGTLNIGGRTFSGGSRAVDKTAQALTDRENLNTAKQTGDISALTDPESESYNPAGAINVLHEKVLDAEATDEVRESALREADSIEQTLTKQVSQLEQQEELFTPEGQQAIARAIARQEAQLEQVPEVQQAEIRDTIENLRQIQEAAQSRSPEQAKEAETQLKELRQRLKATREAIGRMQVDASPNQEQVTQLVNDVQQAAPEQAQAAAEKIMTLTMTNPDAVELSQVEALVSNPDANLTEPQRAALRSFGEAQAALNELKDIGGVRSDIQNGGDGFKGVGEYRNTVRMALMNGDIEAAQGQVEQLAKFAASRTAKYEAIAQAYERVKGTNDSIRIVRDRATGTWSEAPASMTARQLKSAGGVEVTAKSFRLRDSVALEATALNRMAQSLGSLVQAGPIRGTVNNQVEQAVQAEEVAATPDTATEVAQASATDSRSASVEPEVAAVTGELTAIRDAGEVRGREVPATEYQTTNLAAAFFKQVAEKDEGSTQRPLVAVPNFATAVRSGQAKIADFTGLESLTGQQQAAVKRFFGFQRVSKPLIEANMKLREGKNTEFYKFRDYAQFLINADGTIDENLATAISYAAFSWVNDAAGNIRNTDAGINAILGRAADDEVSPAAYKALSLIGTRQAVAISQLGAKVAQTLGLEALENAPANERSRMEASLGAHAMQLLVKMGLAERRTISDVELQSLMGNDGGNPKVKHYFLAPKTREVEGRVVASEMAQAIKESTVGSQSVLDKLFGSDQGATEPSFEPVKFTQKMAKRTQQEVPSVLADILNKEGEKPHYLREDMWQVWGNLSTDALYKIAGVIDTTDVPTHAYMRASQEAKNDGLKAQVDVFGQFFNRIQDVSELGQEQPLYFGRSVWKPQRVGLTSNTINPQTSKIHRHMLRMDNWEVEIDFSNQAAVDGFKLRVLEAFGVKTEAKSTVDVLAGYDAKVNTPAIQNAVTALAEILRGEANDVAANEQAILAGVREGGENFHSLDALVALAQEKNARAEGASGFKTSMMGEVDGVTNGPMLSLLMLGAKDFGTLNQGGFFELTSEFSQFNDFHAEAGNLDLYESTMSGVLARMGNDPLLGAVEVITGKLRDKEGNVSSKGRKVIKQPFTAMMFGSNTKTAVNGMADGFIGSIYERMQEAGSQEELSKVIAAVNQLMGNKRLAWPENMSKETALNTVYNTAQVKAIKDAFYKLVGQPTEKALEDTYALFLARRDTVNQSANLAYDLYEAAYQAKREQLLETAELPRGKSGESFVDLTNAQKREIEESLAALNPVLNTAMSKESNQLDAGMLMAKTKRALNDTNPYMSEVHFGQPVDYIDTDGSVKNAMSLSASGMETQTEGPGVAPLITSIHSTDSSISHNAIQDKNILNIHDAHGAALNDIEGAGQRLNKATFDNMLNYSTASEMVSTLERTIVGFNNLLNDQDMAKRLQPKLKELLGSRKNTIGEQLESIRHVAREADTAKLSMLAEMKAVGQYATEGGSYMVTDADRAAALEALNKVGSTFDESAVAAADNLDIIGEAKAADRKAGKGGELSTDSVQTLAPSTTLNAFEKVRNKFKELREDVDRVAAVMASGNKTLAEAKQVLSEDRQAAVVDAVNQVTKQQRSVWGELGVPVTPSDSALVDLLMNSEGMTAQGLAQALEARSTNPFNKKLLAALARLARNDLPVVVVTAQTGPDGAMGEGVSKARGWYASRQGFDALYVKSPEFVESGITEEMLTHELLHTVLGRVIQRNQGKATEAGQLIQNLESIRQAAKDMISSQGALSAKYSNAVSDVHELVSWGMTNTGFQEEVLKNIVVASNTRGNSLLNGLQRFIETLTKLIFGGRNVAEQNGMGQLILNTSGLFAEAKRMMDKRDSLTLKYEDAVDGVMQMTTHEVFMALASNKRSSPAHEQKLADILDQIVDNLHGPMGAFKNAVARGQAMTTDDAFLKALDTGRLPFASRALASAFVINPQEAYVLEQVEATVLEAMNVPEGLFIRGSLENLWREARQTLSAKSFYQGDWATATEAERAVAQDKYDFLFKPDTTAGSKNNYLARFAALGMASEEVANALSFDSRSQERNLSGMPLASRLVELFRRLMTKLASLHDKTNPNDPASSRLFTLVDRLVDIEAKRRTRIAERKVGVLDQVESALAGAGQKARGAVEALGQSKIFKSSSSPIVRFAGEAISAVAGERVELVLDGITRARDEAFRSQQGTLMGLFSEIRGVNSSNMLAHALFKEAKANEMARKQHIEYTVAQVNAAFKDGGDYLTQKDKDALTRTLLRTNMAALHEAVGMDQLKELLQNPEAMAAKQAELEESLKEFANANYYIGAVKDLAYHKVIGGNVSPNLMMNTANIAKMYGTAKALQISKAEENKIVPVLDQLLAIYAYEYSPQLDKQNMIEVLRTESNRGEENGVDMILKLHSGLMKSSKELLFEGTEALAISGYVPDIFDNKIELIAASKNEIEYFAKRGYALVGDVQTDKAAGLVGDQVLMSRRGSGQIGILTGALSFTGMQAKGTRVDREVVNMLTSKPGTNRAVVRQIRTNIAGEVADMFNRPLSYDPRKAQAQRVAPIMNPNGGIVDYRYTMTEARRDSILDRDNSMDQVLGTLAGQIIDKVNTAQQNTEVVRAMYDQYVQDYKNRPGSYLEVGKNSEDPQLAELYALLPDSTKREIRKVWKSDAMMIPADQLNMIMGYRKYSLTTPFGIPEDERNWAENILVKVAEAVLGEKAALRIGRAEDVIQELVREAKDILVVKNIFTLVGNIVSNVTLLAWEGVSITDAVKNTAIGIKGATQYRQDNKRLIQLQRAVEIGYLPGGTQAAMDEIAVLRDRIARNPIKPLIDAGLMPTIVEDVEADDSQYSYKSLLQKKVERFTDKLPKFIRNTAKFAYVAHDTSLYKFLSQTTQLSDLVSRYALYEHLINRAKDPLSKADALLQVEESFVNYDIPSHRNIQFLNDMGLLMFTKYYLRIQKVIARLVREKPARGLMLVAMNHFVSGLQSVLDSSWLNKIGNNPFQAGPWAFPASLDELPAIKGLINL